MKAVLIERPHGLRQVDLPEPAAPAPGEALVRVHRVGVCGSDYGGFLGQMPFFGYPRIPGHELGVEVLAVGTGVSHVKAGDRCAVEPYLNDPGSFASRQGRPNCCENLRVLGVHTDGGLRARFVLPARKLHLANGLSYDEAALVEPLAIGCHAVNRGACQAGETVLVIGAGPTGLGAAEFARLVGARVIVMDSNPSRLEFVRSRLGVAETIASQGDETDAHRVQRLTGGHWVHCVIDATGSSKSMSGALRFVGFGGRLVLLGLSTTEISFGHPLLHRREATVLASRNALPAEFARTVGLVEAGQINPRPWITHTASFDEFIGEFEKWLKPETAVLKAVARLA